MYQLLRPELCALSKQPVHSDTFSPFFRSADATAAYLTRLAARSAWLIPVAAAETRA